MLLSEPHIARLVPERIFPQPVSTGSFSRIVSSTVHHHKVFSDATFEIKHFSEEEKVAEIKENQLPLLLPEPPVAYLKPKKYDYF